MEAELVEIVSEGLGSIWISSASDDVLHIPWTLHSPCIVPTIIAAGELPGIKDNWEWR